MRIALAALLTAVAVFAATPPPVSASQPSEEPTEAENGVSEVDPGPPEQANGRIEALDRNQRAPWSGMLIEQKDLVRWRLEIDNLRFRLDRDVQLATDTCEVKMKLHTQLLAIENERRELREALLQERIDELAQSNVGLQKDVVEANRRSILEEPVVWYLGGILSAGLLVLATQ